MVYEDELASFAQLMDVRDFTAVKPTPESNIDLDGYIAIITHSGMLQRFSGPPAEDIHRAVIHKLDDIAPFMYNKIKKSRIVTALFHLCKSPLILSDIQNKPNEYRGLLRQGGANSKLYARYVFDSQKLSLIRQSHRAISWELKTVGFTVPCRELDYAINYKHITFCCQDRLPQSVYDMLKKFRKDEHVAKDNNRFDIVNLNDIDHFTWTNIKIVLDSLNILTNKVSYMNSIANLPHLHHNGIIVVDEKYISSSIAFAKINKYLDSLDHLGVRRPCYLGVLVISGKEEFCIQNHNSTSEKQKYINTLIIKDLVSNGVPVPFMDKSWRVRLIRNTGGDNVGQQVVNDTLINKSDDKSDNKSNVKLITIPDDFNPTA